MFGGYDIVDARVVETLRVVLKLHLQGNCVRYFPGFQGGRLKHTIHRRSFLMVCLGEWCPSVKYWSSPQLPA